MRNRTVLREAKRAAAWCAALWASGLCALVAAESPDPGHRQVESAPTMDLTALPFDAREVVRVVNRRAPAVERPGLSTFRRTDGGHALVEARFRVETKGHGIRYFASNDATPDFEILSVRLDRGTWTHEALDGMRWSECAHGLLRGEARDGVTPYLRSLGEEGAQVFWTLAWGRGERDAPMLLTFRVRAEGEPGLHAEGLMFPARALHRRVAFSNLTAVDRTGAAWTSYPSVARVSPRGDRATHEIVFEIPAAFLREARWPLLLDPAVGPDFVADPTATFGPAGANQQNPAAAWNGTHYLVAWQDFRNGHFDIYAARVTSDGTVLDPGGIAVSTAAASQQNPTVASDGDGFFVAWQDARDGGFDIYAARVASDGTVLDPGGIAVSTARRRNDAPSSSTWTSSKPSPRSPS